MTPMRTPEGNPIPPREALYGRRIKTEIETFARNPALTELFALFDYKPRGEIKRNLTVGQGLAEKLAFAQSGWQWDANGKERADAEKIQLTPEQEAAIMGTPGKKGLAERLGMTKATEAKNAKSDALIVLGGGGVHPFWRTAHGKEHGGDVKQVFLLGSKKSFRKQAIIDAQEKDRAAGKPIDPRRAAYDGIALSESAQTEFDLQVAAAETNYGTLQKDGTYSMSDYEISEIGTNGDRIRHYKYKNQAKSKDHPDLFVISAYNREDPANPRVRSSDQFAVVKGLLLPRAQRVIPVTSMNFRNFQHFDARRILTDQFGLDVDTIGFDPSKPPLSPDSPTIYHDAARYLNEVYSTLKGAVALHKTHYSS